MSGSPSCSPAFLLASRRVAERNLRVENIHSGGRNEGSESWQRLLMPGERLGLAKRRFLGSAAPHGGFPAAAPPSPGQGNMQEKRTQLFFRDFPLRAVKDVKELATGPLLL